MNITDEWYTPKEIIESFGEFDLDPCAPFIPLWDTAKIMYNKLDDGLNKEWSGRIWLNPPYSMPLLEQFVKKLSEHGNGIALIFSRCELKMFYEYIFPKATAIKFLRKRIKFYRPNGLLGDSPRNNSMFIAFGDYNAQCLKQNTLDGKFISLK